VPGQAASCERRFAPCPRQSSQPTPVEILDSAVALKKEHPQRTAAWVPDPARSAGLGSERDSPYAGHFTRLDLMAAGGCVRAPGISLLLFQGRPSFRLHQTELTIGSWSLDVGAVAAG